MASVDAQYFAMCFFTLTGFQPLSWQKRLFGRLADGDLPSALDLPTGLGKTSIMAIWLIARAHQPKLPRRLVYVVDRRAVVDQATSEAVKLRGNLSSAQLGALRTALGLEERPLPISTLRGQFVDNREWLADPSLPAIVVGTVDMVGSRLLFSGYGVSLKMRPYHAGLLGADSLVVLDEAHLVPPFAHLLRAVEEDPLLKPKADADRTLVPGLVVLPLSATQRDPGDTDRQRLLFRLVKADWEIDSVVRQRLNSKKRLCFEPLAQRGPDRQLAEAAWRLAEQSGKFFRVLVFCNRRDKSNETSGPSAEGVADAINSLAKGDKKAGRAMVAIHPVELLVGARRVYERDGVAARLEGLGFIGEKSPLDKPAFLVATAAGEVGVDIDADHMVSDLAPWERIVQRLGRVNRRGEGEAEVRVVWVEPSIKNVERPSEAEKRELTAYNAKAVLERLPPMEGGFDASPGALRDLAEATRSDAALRAQIDEATTSEPLRPALNRALIDAWSMTSLQHHTGRPEVEPWLRGWVEEERPQATIVWRTHLPLREGVPDWPHTATDEKEVEEFFEAAPPHHSEKLESEAHRIAEWLRKRAHALLARKASVAEAGIEDEPADRQEEAADDSSSQGTGIQQVTLALGPLRRTDIVALLLTSAGACSGRYTLGDLELERRGDAKRELETELAGKLLVVDARIGGLRHGLLSESCNDLPETADTAIAWCQQAGFRVWRETARPESQVDWQYEDEFVIRQDAQANTLERLVVEHFKGDARREDARSIAKPQGLAVHQDWARRAARHIAKGVGLSEPAANALEIAAALHDEGKQAPRWQRAFKAPRDQRRFGLSGPLAKTRGPIDQALLDGYRHEFGSLPHVEANAEFNALSAEWRDLVLHLVAAHHGFARPVIESRGCDDAPPTMLEERVSEIALRFARMQKRWGPWGLAFLEALLRAADAQASRDNEEGRVPREPEDQ